MEYNRHVHALYGNPSWRQCVQELSKSLGSDPEVFDLDAIQVAVINFTKANKGGKFNDKYLNHTHILEFAKTGDLSSVDNDLFTMLVEAVGTLTAKPLQEPGQSVFLSYCLNNPTLVKFVFKLPQHHTQTGYKHTPTPAHLHPYMYHCRFIYNFPHLVLPFLTVNNQHC